MHLTALANHEKLYIGYDAGERWLYAGWPGSHDQESARMACRRLLEALQRQPCPKVLNDNRNMASTTVQMSDTTLPWLAAMRAAGMRYLAWVYPTEFAARRVFEQALQHLPEPTIVGFDELASAYEWLRRQEASPHPLTYAYPAGYP